MNRLAHDFPSKLRACQMSRTEMFCFVEGVENDRYVYSEIAKNIFSKKGIRAEYPVANILSSNGRQGGKDILVGFFHYLKSNHVLSADFKGKKTTFAFMLDKDVDDLQGKYIISKHVFYTEHYDLQYYLFLHGDVITSAAAGASIPSEEISGLLGDKSAWLNKCITNWKDWLTICLFLKINNISLGGYAVPSKINTKVYGGLDNSLLTKYKAQAYRKSGFDQVVFDELYAAAEEVVNQLWASGKADQIFKGKWYLYWLVNHLEAGHGVKLNAKNLACILCSNLNWKGSWTKRYQVKLSKLVKAHTSGEE